MKFQQSAVLTSLRRAQKFLDDNAAALGVVNQTARKELDDVVTQMTNLSVTQDSSTRGSLGETARQRSLRVALRQDHMAPIAQVAKYKLQDVPEFAALMLPPANATADSQVVSATAMADAASAHAQTFTDSGLPSTFLDDIRAAASAVSTSLVDRDQYQGKRSGATRALTSVETQGRSLLRMLNALIVSHVRNDPELSGAWTVTKTVRQKPGPAAGSHEATATPAKPAGASTTTPASTPTLVSTPAPAPVNTTPAVAVAA